MCMYIVHANVIATAKGKKEALRNNMGQKSRFSIMKTFAMTLLHSNKNQEHYLRLTIK